LNRISRIGGRELQKLKRLLRPLVQASRRATEFKAGILLAQVVGDGGTGQSSKAGLAPAVSNVREWRADFSISHAAFEKRIAQGNELYELFVDQQAVSYGWVARHGVCIGVLHDLQLKVPDNAFYLWDCATNPAFQGQGHFQSLLKAILAAHESGTTALVAVDSKNDASRAALNKAGFQPVFTYVSIRVVGFVILSWVVEAGKFKKAQPRFDQLTASMNQA
jgi:ribosomal protein S18 acetylase RimI-like enzyme